MAYFENPNVDFRKVVKWGNFSDVCLLCLRDKMDEKKCDSIRARKELSGKLENKPVVKIRHAGSDIVICREHVTKLLNDIEAMENGTTGITKEAATAIASGEAQEFMKDMPEVKVEEKKSKRVVKHEQDKESQ